MGILYYIAKALLLRTSPAGRVFDEFCEGIFGNKTRPYRIPPLPVGAEPHVAGSTSLRNLIKLVITLTLRERKQIIFIFSPAYIHMTTRALLWPISTSQGNAMLYMDNINITLSLFNLLFFLYSVSCDGAPVQIKLFPGALT